MAENVRFQAHGVCSLTLILSAVTVSGAAPRVQWLSRERRRNIDCDSGNTWPRDGLTGEALHVLLS